MRYLSIFVVAACWTSGLAGQSTASASSGPNGFSGSASFPPAPPFEAISVAGAAYSAEEVTEQVQTLADGTHINRGSIPIKKYRDSLGRTRRERPLFRGMAIAASNPESPIVVEIIDPVAQVKYTLDTVNKVAHRQQLPPAPVRANPSPSHSQTLNTGTLGSGVAVASGTSSTSSTSQAPAAEKPQHSHESLGTQTIEGVLVNGTRTTTTFPTGSRGNDRPISSTVETWLSPELKVVVLSRYSDPQSGEHTQKLTNISRAEPSPDLFQPPLDYSVVDEAGGFTIRWGSQP